MEDIRQELNEAYEKAARCCRADALLKQLRADVQAWEKMRAALERRMEQEIDDAEKLEAGGLSVAISKMMGKHDEQLQQARAERYAAKVKHEDAIHTLEQLRRRITELEAERASLEGSAEAYAALYEQKVQRLLISGGETAQRLAALTAHLEDIQKNILRIESALRVGRRLAEQLKIAHKELEEAGDAYMSRGAMLTRTELIDSAKSMVQEARAALDRFNATLAEVCIVPDAGDIKGSLLRFAEVSFGEMVLDWPKMYRLDRSLENVKRAEADIGTVMDRLKGKAESEQVRLRSLEDELLILVMEA